jgi:hypothetical protein
MTEQTNYPSVFARLWPVSPFVCAVLFLTLFIGALAIKSHFKDEQTSYNNRHLDMCLQKLENEQNIELLNIKQKMCFQRWGYCK